MPAEARRGLDRGEWGVLALVAALGVVNLSMPFGGDQALFASYARSMDEGFRLYRDLWDSKPPGLYLFFQLAGNVFGYNQMAGHVLELLYLLAFSLVLLVTSRSWLERRDARLALPLFTVGIYYLIAEAKMMAQAEVLAGFPLYLALWFSTRGAEARSIRRNAFFSGLAGGAVLWLKLYFLPLLAAIWALTLLRARREPGGPLRSWTRRIGCTGAGFAVPVAGMALWVLAHGVGPEFWWTAFVYPRSAIGELHEDYRRMWQVTKWFTASFAVAFLFGLWALWCSARGARRRGGMLAGALAWFLVGLLLVYGEKSWWKYYSLIVMVPVGLLGAVGLDEALRHAGRRTRLVLAGLCLLLLLEPLEPFAWKANTLRRNDFGLTAAGRLSFRKKMHNAYRLAVRENGFIETELEPDDTLHVFGDPLILMISGRTDAIPINGWAPQTWSPEMWRKILEQLRRAKPDWVYMTGYVARLATHHFPELMDYMRAEYEFALVDKYRAWFRRREGPPRDPGERLPVPELDAEPPGDDDD